MNRVGVLLVGGGFIGTALARRLVAAGYVVHVLALSLDDEVRDGTICHRGAQSDTSLVTELLRTCGTVVHLASATTPGTSARSPCLEVTSNLLPLAAFMEALGGRPPHRLLFISSGGAIYGNPSRLPAGEDLPSRPLSYHGAGKVASEKFLDVLAYQHREMSLAILRPSNVYGPGQPLKAGFGIVRTLLDKARSGEPIEIWGSGGQIRDFLYIDDLVDACQGLLEASQLRGVFNAGSGQGVTLSALVETVERVTRRKLKVLPQPDRGVDVDAVYLDSSRLRAATGWAPRVSLEEGIARTWADLLGQDEGGGDHV